MKSVVGAILPAPCYSAAAVPVPAIIRATRKDETAKTQKQGTNHGPTSSSETMAAEIMKTEANQAATTDSLTIWFSRCVVLLHRPWREFAGERESSQITIKRRENSEDTTVE